MNVLTLLSSSVHVNVRLSYRLSYRLSLHLFPRLQSFRTWQHGRWWQMMVDNHGPKILSHPCIHLFAQKSCTWRSRVVRLDPNAAWSHDGGSMAEALPETGLRLMRLMTPYFNHWLRKREINSEGTSLEKKHEKKHNLGNRPLEISAMIDAQQTCAAEQKDLRHSNTTLLTVRWRKSWSCYGHFITMTRIAHHRKQTTGIHWIDFCYWNAIYIL